MSLRRFLYLTPYFPPLGRVGALRPLKFARHLPRHGWAPVVLCDWWPGATLSGRLTDFVPPEATVIRAYSRRAKGCDAALAAHLAQPQTGPAARMPPAKTRSMSLPSWLNNPELIPLGEHSVHMGHATRAARRALAAHPECEAIVVNADPFAALLVGARLSRETGLPLIQDLRDPWSICDLRRPRRPAPIRALVDWLEARAFRAASKIIINSETALADYRAHYAGRIAPERFCRLRNHHDTGLIAEGQHPGFDRFTLLFLGHFRRFVEGDVLLAHLAALKARGCGDAQLVVTGQCPPESWARAQEMGVSDMLVLHPFVPYAEIGAIMAQADILVALSNQTDQRIPAKLYDYFTTTRPVLTFADAPEIGRMLEGNGGRLYGLDQAEPAAEYVATLMAAGRHPTVERDGDAFSSARATARLAALLDEVTAT